MVALPNDKTDFRAILLDEPLQVHAPEWTIQRQFYIQIVLHKKVDIPLILELPFMVDYDSLLHHFLFGHLLIIEITSHIHDLVSQFRVVFHGPANLRLDKIRVALRIIPGAIHEVHH